MSSCCQSIYGLCLIILAMVNLAMMTACECLVYKVILMNNAYFGF